MYQKYLKYKKKYLELKKMIGGLQKIVKLNNVNEDIFSNTNKLKYAEKTNEVVTKGNKSSFNYFSCNNKECSQIDDFDFKKENIPIYKQIETVIDGITFQLVSKNISDSRDKVIIRSIDENETIFAAYRSKSQLNFWRFCFFDRPGHYYKGLEIDYVQETFLHIKLQKFINDNIDKLDDDEDIYCPVLYEQSDSIKKKKIFTDIIEHENRPLSILPSEIIEQNNIVKCGYASEEAEKEINVISNYLEQHYNIGEHNRIMNYKTENLVFDSKILSYDGELYEVNLNSKNKDHINLKLIYLKLNHLELLGSTEEYTVNKQNIKIPIYMTVQNDKINKLGLYNNYVILYKYICKLFEYTQQCKPYHLKIMHTKKKNYICGFTYIYMGDLYENIWPLNKL